MIGYLLRSILDGIGHRLLGIAPELVSCRARLPVSLSAPDVELRWTLRGNGRAGAAVVTEGWSTPLRIVGISGDGLQAERRGHRWILGFERGFSQSEVVLRCRWDEPRRPLPLPAALPQLAQDTRVPRARPELLFDEGDTACRVSRLRVGPTDRAVSQAVASFGVPFGEPLSLAEGLSLQRMGADWASFSSRWPDQLPTLVLRALSTLEAVAPLQSRGELQVRIVQDPTECASGGLGGLYVAPNWLRDESRQDEAVLALCAQLSELWWGGLVQITGPNAITHQQEVRRRFVEVAWRQAQLKAGAAAPGDLASALATARAVVADLAGRVVHVETLRKRLGDVKVGR